MQDDLADAARWAAQKGWSDSGRVALMGGSYGGYATAMGLIRHPDTFRCGIDTFRCGIEWAGVTDLEMLFTTAESDPSQEALHYGMRH